jgi:uncharacterized damage-inducible protein DinB
MPCTYTLPEMTRPEVLSVPTLYRTYVEYVKDTEVLEALRHAGKLVQELLLNVPEEKGTHRYAEGKWSIKEVLNHMMDVERVFAYRALRFSRNDQTPLHPFAENEYAPRANAHSRTIHRLAHEMQWLRETTIDLYASFTPEMLMFEGTASGKRISVLTLGYIIAGHDLHHRQILLERYLNR